MNNKIFYVASVYSYGADKHLMQARYEFVEEWIHYSQDEEYMYYSPIVAGHNYALVYDLPKTYDFHKTYDRGMIKRLDGLVVLKMDDWKYSEGVQDEIQYAESIGKTVEYIDVDDWSEKRAEELRLDELTQLSQNIGLY